MYALPLDVERTGQRRPHCHSTSSAPKRYAQARVAVPPTRDCTLRAEWQRHPHCHSMSSVPRRYAQARVAVRTVRSGPSGSATRTGLHAQGRVAVPPTLPLDVERTGQRHPHCHSTSSAPKRYAQGQVAVPPTRDRTLRAEWQCDSHCHLVVNVRGSATHTATWW